MGAKHRKHTDTHAHTHIHAHTHTHTLGGDSGIMRKSLAERRTAAFKAPEVYQNVKSNLLKLGERTTATPNVQMNVLTVSSHSLTCFELKHFQTVPLFEGRMKLRDVSTSEEEKHLKQVFKVLHLYNYKGALESFFLNASYIWIHSGWSYW